MSAEHPLHALIDAVERGYGDLFHHHHSFKDTVMKYLAELIADRKTLIGYIAAQTARADTAEAKIADLESQIAADEATAKAALDADTAADASTKPTSPVVTTSGTATITVVPIAATPAVNPTTGTTTDPGTTTHEDASTGVTTTVDHTDGSAAAVNAAGNPVPTDPAVAAAAVQATADAGVTVPAA